MATFHYIPMPREQQKNVGKPKCPSCRVQPRASEHWYFRVLDQSQSSASEPFSIFRLTIITISNVLIFI